MVERADISQVLAQMRTVQAQLNRGAADVAAHGRIEAESFVQPQQKTDFSALFSQAIDGVNGTQKQADSLRVAYETGVSGVSLTQVMVAAEKSSVAFTAMTQVRNRLVEAYKEIMSMPI
jgi:flagellar hook-basal body complex protein FliE